MALAYILYIIFLLLELVLAMGVSFFALSMVWSSIKGAPFVPTKQSEVDIFLKEAKLKKGKLFIEPGCGDGRVVRTAVKEYDVRGIGIDVNPILIWWSNFKARMFRDKVKFMVGNVYKMDFSKADYIYIFLMPEMIEKFAPRMKKEAKKGCVIISHGFKVPKSDRYMFKIVDHKPFPTYYYKYR